MGKISGQPLKSYVSEAEARSAANHVRLRYGNDMIPYRCERCRMWHLSPRERHTPSHACSSCVGGDGRPKQSYRSKADADRRARHIARDEGLRLRSYSCPHGEGWHLTKSPNDGW